MKKSVEKVGQITIGHKSSTKYCGYKGAEYLRDLVAWMNKREECFNVGKSNLQLMGEFNKVWKE